MFLTPADSLSPNPDRLIADAKQVALGLARAGYRPGRPRTDVPALGRPALATFKMVIHNGRRERPDQRARRAGRDPRGHDPVRRGPRARASPSEQDFLDLEREAFLSLLGTPKTQERIQHMLKNGKPLRN